jgi:hypothetical protein
MESFVFARLRILLITPDRNRTGPTAGTGFQMLVSTNRRKKWPHLRAKRSETTINAPAACQHYCEN